MWVLAGSAAAAEEPPLAFVKSEALSASCSELAGEGIEVAIRNETGEKQQAKVAPAEFSEEGGVAVPVEKVCGGLRIEPGFVSLEGAGSATVRLHGEAAEEGSFSGSLALFAEKGAVVRREVAISSKPAAETLEATPLVGKQTTRLEGSARGPIWIPVEKSAEEPSSAAVEGAVFNAGAVSGRNGSAAVVFDGEREPLNAFAEKLKLEIDGDGLSPGTYSGTVDLNPGDKEKGTVELELKVAASWLVAAFFLAVGILVALVLQRSTGRWVPRARLRKRIRELSKRHQDLVSKLTAAGNEEKPWRKFEIEADDIKAQQRELEASLDNASRYVAIQIDKKVLESLEAAIAVVEAQIDLLKEIPEHATDLEDELGELRADEVTDLGKPSLGAAAGTALAGRAVRADELKLCIEEIDARTKQVRGLQVLQGRLDELATARESLRTVDKANLDKLKATLGEFDKKLGMSRNLIWKAETAEDLASAATQIQDTAKTAAELWQLLPHPSQPPVEVLQQVFAVEPLLAMSAAAPEPSSGAGAAIAAFEVPPGAPSAPPAPSALPPSPPEPSLDAASAEREVSRARFVQGFAVVVAAIFAIASGLIALYTGNETWGSCWDYMAAATWGLGLQASVTALAMSLDALGPLAGLSRRA